MRSTMLLAAFALASLAPSTALAQATAFAERAKIVGTGTQVHLYGLPTRNSNGVVRYFDVTIDLTIGGAGKPSARAVVSATPPPDATSTEFVPGSYVGAGLTCGLQTAAFSGGRTEVLLNCEESGAAAGTAGTASIAWYTGGIATNPFSIDLLLDQLDLVPGNDQFAWGQVTSEYGSGALADCLNLGDNVSARQVGDTLALVNYGNSGNTPDCGLNLFKQAP